MTSPLERPQDIYRPFTTQETQTLRNFVANARELGRMRFFTQVPHQFTIAGKVPFAMDEPDTEAVFAATSLLRQLYNPREPTSAAVLLKILKRSAHEHAAAERDDAIRELRSLGAWTRDAVAKGVGIGIIFDHGTHQTTIKPAEILNAYFHGRYLHSGNDLSELVAQLDDVGLGRFTFYQVMKELAKAYWVIANGVERILAVPALVDHDSVRTR